jgi:hypothetical protein
MRTTSTMEAAAEHLTGSAVAQCCAVTELSAGLQSVWRSVAKAETESGMQALMTAQTGLTFLCWFHNTQAECQA